MQAGGATRVTDVLADEFGITDIASVNFFTNAVDTRTKGAELVVDYGTEAWNGRLNLTGSLTSAITLANCPTESRNSSTKTLLVACAGAMLFLITLEYAEEESFFPSALLVRKI